MWIKICGNMNVEDARRVAELGADAVGFVFAQSVRQVTASQVAEIVAQLPDSIEKIGVFSSTDAEEIAGIVRMTKLTGVQLHGGFDLELARRLKAEFGRAMMIIQVLHWRLDGGADSAAENRAQMKEVAKEPAIDRVLLDSMTKTASGGTGERFDWTEAQAALDIGHATRVIVAGGLNPSNVSQAIAELSPWGVDVASGVEASKGRKDPSLIKQFIAAAKELQETQAGPG